MKKVISILLSTIIIFSIIGGLDFSVAASETAGKIGDNVYYSVKDNICTISGTGATYNYGANLSPLNYFSNYLYFNKAIIEKGVTTIGTSLFQNAFLKTIEIPDSVTYIGNEAFKGSYIENITIPGSVYKIDSPGFVFASCHWLEKIEVSDDNKYFSSVDGVLFNKEQSKLLKYPASKAGSTYICPDTVEEISEVSFYNNNNLEKITLSSNTKVIKFSAFDDAEKLSEVDLKNVEIIESFAFASNNKISNIRLPKTLKQIYDNAFEGCYYFTVDPDNEYFSSENGTLFNKDKTVLLKYGGERTESIYTVPLTVKEIYYYAFSCSPLTDIYIPDNVDTIGWYAFEDCRQLKNIRLSKNLTEIAQGTFEDCVELGSVIIPKNVETIGWYAFSGCNDKKEFEIIVMNKNCEFVTSKEQGVTPPEGMTISSTGLTGTYKVFICSYRDSEAQKFANDNNFEYIYLDDFDCDSGNHFFSSHREITVSADCVNDGYTRNCCVLCEKEIKTVIPATGIHSYDNGTVIKEVSENDFGIVEYKCQNCNAKKEVVIPNTTNFKCEILDENSVEITEYIGSDTKIVIPTEIGGKTVVSIGEYAFTKESRPGVIGTNPDIEEVIIPNTVNEIKTGAFWYCSNLKNVILGNNVKSIGVIAFSGTALNEIIFPDSIEYIGASSFQNSLLSKIVIPNKVLKIGFQAFYNTTFYNNQSNWEDNMLYIGNHLIKSLSNARHYNVKYGTITIADEAFKYDSPKSIYLPESLSLIGEDAFYNINADTSSIVITNKDCTIVNGEELPSGNDSTINSSITIYGYYNSSAEKYTIKNNMNFVSIDNHQNCNDSHLFVENDYCVICGWNYREFDPHIVELNGENKKFNNKVLIFTPNMTGNYLLSSTDDFLIYSDGYKDDVDLFIFAGKPKVLKLNKGTTYIIESYSDENNLTIKLHDNCNFSLEQIISATCKEDGYTLYKCECGNTYRINYVPATGHTVAEDKAVTPTCTQTGLTEGSHCSVCGTVITAQNVVSATGHSYDNGKVTEAATCTETGVMTYTCTVCGETKTEAIAKTAHTYKNYVTKATTGKNGSIVNKCSVCGTVKSKSTIYYPKTVTLSATSYTYDGKVKKPTVKVVDSNGKTISSSNYTVTYSSGRKNVGKYNVKITFKGNYSGSITKSFTIKPKNTSISSVSAKSKGFTVKWKKQSTQTTGYQIQYSTSSKFTNAKTVTVSKNSTTSKTISKLSAKKKYYVRIRTYKTVSGTKYYSSWSKAKTVTTKK